MSKSVYAGAIALILGVAALLYLRPWQAPSVDASGEGSDARQQRDGETQLDQSDESARQRRSVARAAANPALDLDVPDQLKVAQEDWDRRHGVPAEEEWKDMLLLTEAELEDQARRGSVLAMTALGFKIVSSSEPGDSRTVAGFKWLDEATVHGSAFAAQQYGELALTHFVSGESEQGFRNQVSASYYALAYLMGDSSAIPGFQVAAGIDPTGQSVSLYLGMGMSRLQSVQASRAVRGLQPLALEPRPAPLTLGIIEPPAGG